VSESEDLEKATGKSKVSALEEAIYHTKGLRSKEVCTFGNPKDYTKITIR
jgi:hypothetical protein